MKSRWILTVLALIVLWGCVGDGTPPKPHPVICRICIRQAQEQTICSDPQTMRQILNGLRWPGQLVMLRETPGATPELTVTLLLTDGSQRTYGFRGDRYMKIGDGPWNEADPERLAPLLSLLHAVRTSPGSM